MEKFRGGLVFEAHRLVYHSTLGLRVIKKKRRPPNGGVPRSQPRCAGSPRTAPPTLAACFEARGVK